MEEKAPTKRFLIFFALCCVLITSGAHGSERMGDSIYCIGVSSRTFEKINRNDALAALKAWSATVIKEQNLLEKIEFKMFDGPTDELRNAFLQNRLDAVSITVEELMSLKIQPEAIYLGASEKGFHVRYAIIVHRDSGIVNFDGLMGRKLIIHEGQRMVLALPWLETLLVSHTKKKNSHWLESLNRVENPSKGILQVYFRQSDAALITKDAFEMACELNPQLRKDINVLFVSPPFITSFFLFHSINKKQSAERLEKAIIELHTTPGGRQVLTVFQSSRMEKQPISILDSTKQFLIEHQRLMKESSSRGARP